MDDGLVVAASTESPANDTVPTVPQDSVLGTPGDNLPFEASGEKLASIAWRTWIYTDVGPKRNRYGYLRAGEVVDRRGPVIQNDGCAEGWFRINPRGFVCIGKGATLDTNHPVVSASRTRARRGEGLPYTYALSKERAPHLYFTLPSKQKLREVEGAYESDAAQWLAQHRSASSEDPFVQAQPPDFLMALGTLEKPYGVESGLRFSSHAGQADADSGFAILQAFEFEGRGWGLTTELDLIALDRVRLVEESAVTGMVLGPDEDLPAALVKEPWITQYERLPNGKLRQQGSLKQRTLLKLTGKHFADNPVTYWETANGGWVAEVGIHLIGIREQFPSVATGTRKWIDVSLKHQTLVAYVGKKAEFVALISSGSGGLGDPEKVPATIQGTFMIHTKEVSSTMDGEDDKPDSFNLRDVPFVQYFHKGFALHGTYWHDDFGRWRSHGCVNLSPRDSAWLFEWTDPHVPAGWHGVINKERGTVVYIHP
jgi:lipoprotein-anchoring transpeptidase ErfK/SrfK